MLGLFLIFMLSVSLPLQFPADIVFAQEAAAPDETVSETTMETIMETEDVTAADSEEADTETFAETETETMTETQLPDLTEEEVLLPETEAETETETFSETVTETESETETETETEAVVSRITGFVGLSDKEKTVVFTMDDKPSIAELQTYLPETLSVHLDGSNDPEKIKVTWEGPSDYEESNYFYYRFTPVWDETRYILDTKDEVPAIWVTFSGNMLNAPVTSSANEEKVYKYLVSTLKLSKAAALGIMANIEAESDFDPGLIEAGNSIGFGLLQWSFDRRTAIEKYLDKNGFADDSIEGQLKYMMVELNQSYYKHILTKLQSVPNTADGAYEAAYYFCKYYEVPADTEGQSISRGSWARDRYWPMYSGKQAVVDQGISLSSYTLPGPTLNVGDYFNIRGVVSSQNKLTSVNVGVYNASGVRVIGRSVAPNAKSYNLINVDSLIKFGTLKAGIYRYKVIASDSKGTSTLANKLFTVLADTKTINNGTYNILCRDKTTLGLYSAGSSKNENANIVLGKTAANTPFMSFTFTYKSNGYYVVKNVGSGKYLAVLDFSAKSGANVVQNHYGVLWQVLPDGKSGYYLIPKCAPTCCLYVQGGKAEAKQNIQISTSKMAAMQSFKLLAPGASGLPTISGQTLPKTMEAGTPFSIRGTVKSATNITSLTVGVFNAANRMIVGKTVKPNSLTYNLKSIDTSIKFGTIPAGVYYYRITAKNAAGEKKLVNHAFAVLANGRTVKNGTYNILLKSDKTLGLGIKNTKADFANLYLRKVSGSSNYLKFAVAYQSNGYYKIKNVGSGKYIGIAGQSSKAGALVRQSGPGTLFQILYDGVAYRFIPKCATGTAMKVAGTGAAAENLTIKTYNIQITSKQQFVFKSAATAAKATISGQTVPSDQYVGSPFSIRGVISSTTNLTKVTVGVYNSSGGSVIGKTVTPNAKSYDLRNVDTSIKFGTLKAGTYIYKVMATNSAGTVTLVSKQFTVK